MATTTAKKEGGIHFAWFVLIGVLLMMGLCRGGINSGMGLFFQPISADMHIGVGEVAMMSSISALITMFWSPFAGRLLDKFDIRIITVVAVAIQAGCFAALSLVDAVWGFYALAGIMAFGSVFATQLVGPMMINRWFKDKNGLAMGIMMSFVAICSAVLSPVVASIIASNGWRMGYIVLGVLALVIVIPAVLIWFRTPEQKGQLPPRRHRSRHRSRQERRSESRRRGREEPAGPHVQASAEDPRRSGSSSSSWCCSPERWRSPPSFPPWLSKLVSIL